MDFMTMLMGGTALQGLGGIFGNLFGSNTQSKSIDKAMQFQMQQQAMAMQLQKQMLEEAKTTLNQGKGTAANFLSTGLTGANEYLQGSLGGANDLTQAGLDKSLAYLNPYAAIGQLGTNALTANADYLTKPFTMDQAALEATPGYKFALNQGLRAQQQSATTRGLGLSGAQLKGAADFATGLADQTYGNQFQRELQARNDLATRIGGFTGIGQSAAGSQAGLQTAASGAMADRTMATGGQIGSNILGTNSALAGNEMSVAQMIANLMYGTGANIGGQQMQLGGSIGNLLTQQGAVNAAGIVGAGNAFGNTAGGLSSNLLLSQLLGGSNPFGQFSTAGGGVKSSNAFGQYAY